MNEYRSVLERAGSNFAPLDLELESILRRRDRKRRNQRVAAGIVGVVVALAAILVGASVVYFGAQPAEPVTPPATSGTIAFSSDGQIFLANPDATITQITHGGAGGTAIAWSPDGSRLLFGRDQGLWVMDADGTSVVRLVAHINPGDEGLIGTAHFSPDGTKVAYQSGREIFVMDADGGSRVRITNDADAYFWYGTADFSWSPDGTRIAFAKGKRGRAGIFTVRPDGTGLERLPTDPLLANAEHPVWSPDGSKIAFSSEGTNNASPQAGHFPGGVFVMNPDGSDVVRVAHGGAHAPIWSPDGSKIAADDGGSVYIVTSDGTIGNHLVGCAKLGMDWSADSEHVVVMGTLYGTTSGQDGACGKGAAIFLADAVFTSDADGPPLPTKLVQPARGVFSFWTLWQPSGSPGTSEQP